MSAQAVVQLEAELNRERTNAIALELGETALEKFKEYEKTYPTRTLLEQFEKQLGVLYSLNAAQRQRMIELLDAQPLDVREAMCGQFTVPVLVYPGFLPERIARSHNGRRGRQI